MKTVNVIYMHMTTIIGSEKSKNIFFELFYGKSFCLGEIECDVKQNGALTLFKNI